MTPLRAYLAALALLLAGTAAVVAGAGLPWLTLAIGLGVVATRGVGRVVVGALVCVAGLAAVAASLLGSREESSWMLVAVGGILLLGSGIWTVLRGRSWPAMGARYESGAGAGSRHKGARPLSAWEAQDRGLDPTADAADGAVEPPPKSG